MENHFKYLDIKNNPPLRINGNTIECECYLHDTFHHESGNLESLNIAVSANIALAGEKSPE